MLSHLRVSDNTELCVERAGPLVPVFLIYCIRKRPLSERNVRIIAYFAGRVHVYGQKS